MSIAGRIFLFKTRHDPRFLFDENASAVEIALATAAAPIFFPQAKITAQSGAIYVDGGVWANCPALAAVTEAVPFLDTPPDAIDLLGVGTLSEPASFVHGGKSSWFGLKPGLIEWAPQLVGLMFRGQMETSWAIASLLTGRRSIRVDAMVEPGIYALDAVVRPTRRHIFTSYCVDGQYTPFIPHCIIYKWRRELLCGLHAHPKNGSVLGMGLGRLCDNMAPMPPRDWCN
jgi:hypothetical protein